MTPLLEARGIYKAYDGVQALKNVSFTLFPGEVHALTGENGAGKSTLIRVLTGAVAFDAGEIFLDGSTTAASSARSKHIRALYQHQTLFPDLTVAENIALVEEASIPFAQVNWRKRNEQATHLLAQLETHIRADALAGSLSTAERQIVELAKLLQSQARIVIMDEPTAPLGDRDVDILFRIVNDLKKQGCGIIYISHRFGELFELAERVTVLRDGESMGTFPMAQMSTEELIRLMVGRRLDVYAEREAAVIGSPGLEVKGLTCRDRGVRHVSIRVDCGEVVGLAGLIGAGRTEFAEAVFGLHARDEGEIFVKGKRVSISTPTDAVLNGISYLPEDRRQHGLVMDFSIAQNISLSNLQAISRAGALDFEAEKQIAERYREQFRIKAPSVQAPVRNLSGGNQQKVALGRALVTKPSVLILDEPTQGVDVAAKSDIHRTIGDLARAGTAVLVISSEIPELLALCDRIAVMHGGRITGVLNREQATAPKLMQLALGHSETVQ